MNEWEWNLSKLSDIQKNNLKVFSCFSCGGGSTMGYKLAGFDVIGNVEIDPRMMRLYKENHNPKFPFEMSVQEFKVIPDSQLPDELFNLDILDGSPPCSTFSVSGVREKKWGALLHLKKVKQSRILMIYSLILLILLKNSNLKLSSLKM